MVDNKKIYRNISLSLGKDCFVFCPGCYNNKVIHHNPEKLSIIKADEIINFIKKIKEKINLSEITISGGDPLTYEQLPELIGKFKEMSIFVKLDTLGTTFLSDAQSVFPHANYYKQLNLEKLSKNIGIIGIPLDGSCDEIISKFRTGRKNLLNEILSVLSMAEKYNTPVGINTVVNKFNINDLENIFLTAEKFTNIQKIQFFQFCPTGCLAKINREAFEVETSDFINKTNELKEKYTGHRIKIEAKPCANRGNNYLFVNKFGIAYHTDIFEKQNNSANGKIINKKIYGSIKNADDFAIILNKGLRRDDI